MAKLIKCRDCDHEISKKAKSCPSCGAPQKKRTSPVTKLLAVIIFGATGIVLFAGGGGSSSYNASNDYSRPSQSGSTAKSKPKSNREMFLASPGKALAWMGRDKSTIENMLKDADSAKFENVFISFVSDSPVTCGTVNAKNSFGGYSGFKDFIAAKSAGISVVRGDGQMADSEFVKTWNLVCMDPIRI